MDRIQVFSTRATTNAAGDSLTSKFDKWRRDRDSDNDIEIKDTEVTSNKYGWMLVITYREIENDTK